MCLRKQGFKEITNRGGENDTILGEQNSNVQRKEHKHKYRNWTKQDKHIWQDHLDEYKYRELNVIWQDLNKDPVYGDQKHKYNRTQTANGQNNGNMKGWGNENWGEMSEEFFVAHIKQ